MTCVTNFGDAKELVSLFKMFCIFHLGYFLEARAPSIVLDKQTILRIVHLASEAEGLSYKNGLGLLDPFSLEVG